MAKAKATPETPTIRELVYAVGDYRAQLDAAFQISQGEETEETDALERALDGTVGEVVERICRWRLTISGLLTMQRAELERVEAAIRRLENKDAWAESLIKQCLESAGVERLEAGTFGVSLQKGRERCVPAGDPRDLPPEVTRTEAKLKMASDEVDPSLRVLLETCGATIKVEPDLRRIAEEIKSKSELGEALLAQGCALVRGPSKVVVR